MKKTQKEDDRKLTGQNEIAQKDGIEVSMKTEENQHEKHERQPEATGERSRPYDLVLFGATGFTGRLTAHYIAEHARREQLAWAIAGRRRDALEQIREECRHMSGGSRPPDLIVADVHQPETIRAMAASTRIILNTAGPFAIYGPAVVTAAAEAGTHYTDITGEPDFINNTYLKLDETARKTGSVIVNACGFDSIPADLTVWHAVRHLPADEGVAVRCYAETRARFSGGTLSTVIEALYRRSKGEKPVRIHNPRHHDAPVISRKIHRTHSSRLGKTSRRWAIPMPVSDIDIVRRSAMRMPDHYGHAFSYAQFFLLKGFSNVVKLAVFFGATAVLVRFDWFRAWIRRKTPAGTGPSEEVRKKSWFQMTAMAVSSGGKRCAMRMEGGDPGYDETAKMVAEASFCLLEMDKGRALGGGVMTPAEAMAVPLMKRLRDAGIQMAEVEF